MGIIKKFRNTKVRTKLILGFALVLLLSLIMAISAIISVNRINQDYTYLLNYPQSRVEFLISLTTNISDMRRATTGIALNMNTDIQVSEDYYTSFYTYSSRALKNMDGFLTSAQNDTVHDPAILKENISSMESIQSSISEYQQNVDKAMIEVRQGNWEGMNTTFLEGAKIITSTETILDELYRETSKFTEDKSDEISNDKNASVIIYFILFVLILILSIITIIFISRIISRPLVTIANFFKHAGTTGDIVVTPELSELAEGKENVKDEIAQISVSLQNFLTRILDISTKLEAVSNRDLTVGLQLQSEKDIIGLSMQKMLDNLNEMLNELRISSDQVSSEAKHISQSSQNIASGSSEQASNIEFFSTSLDQLQERTMRNAENAQKAREANIETTKKLDDVISSMNEMKDAMKEIQDSSENITKIIGVIDDIAFQTNILALNAAVEAARAGQQGKGFAVVADEVRALAAKSAEAAKESSALIEKSYERVQTGHSIVEKTNTDIETASDNAEQSTRIVDAVAIDSNEQIQAITKITKNIDQISSVVQANSAIAEETAASAQNMSHQSILLNEIVNRFMLKHNNIIDIEKSDIDNQVDVEENIKEID